MSYILDALKKAEAERKVGDLPELYTPAYASPVSPIRAAMFGKAALGIGLAVGTAAVVALVLVRPWSSPPLNVASPPSPTKDSSVVKAVPAPPLPPVREIPRSRPAPVEKKSPAPTPVEKKAEAAPSSDAKLPALRELPPEIQREIPALTTNGFLYSPNKTDRTVLLNQKLMHEGQQVAPDLVLEQLTPNGMVLNYKGTRFRTSY